MLGTEVIHEVRIRRPVGQVFEYVTTPANWKAWHPNTRYTEGAVDHSTRPGEELVEYVRFFGIPGGTFRWSVTARRPGVRWELNGVAEFAPFHFVLTYTFSPAADDSTHFRRSLVYSLGQSRVQRALNPLAVRPYVQISSAFAVRRLKAALEKA